MKKEQIIGIGCDLVENERIESSLQEAFINQVLTTKEQEIYHKKIGKQKIQFLAGRFACKEAIIKALSGYENPHLLELEIINNIDGKPIITYKNYEIFISISHEISYSIGYAMITKKNM